MQLRRTIRAGAVAAVLSGIPSTLHAVATGRDPLEATLAAGSILLPGEVRRARLLAAAVPVHLALSFGWTFVLDRAGVRTARAGAVAGLAIAARRPRHRRPPLPTDSGATAAAAGRGSRRVRRRRGSAARALEALRQQHEADRATLRARRRHIAREQKLVVLGNDPQVNVRRTARVGHWTRSLEAEAACSVRHDGRAAGEHVHAAPVRLPEMDACSGDRAAVDGGEDDARQHVAGADLRPPRRRAAAKWSRAVVQRREAAGRCRRR